MKERIIELLGNDWYNLLEDEINKEYFIKIAKFINYRRKSKTIYPESDEIFRAYKLCNLKDLKVVILGQDPYYNGQADGLAFSFKNKPINTKKLQSLNVIWEEIEQDIKFGLYLDYNYNLEWLAKQGVLLLNTVLTVEKGKPNSHKDIGWQKFTLKTIYKIIKEKENVVFMLWGSEAKNAFNKVLKYVPFEINNHLVLIAPHPAADIYKSKNGILPKPNYPNTFLGCKHFSKCNKYLEEHNIEEIRW